MLLLGFTVKPFKLATLHTKLFCHLLLWRIQTTQFQHSILYQLKVVQYQHWCLLISWFCLDREIREIKESSTVPKRSIPKHDQHRKDII